MDNFKSRDEQIHFLPPSQSPYNPLDAPNPVHTGTTYIKFDKKLKNIVIWSFIALMTLLIFALVVVIVRQFSMMGQNEELNAHAHAPNTNPNSYFINASIVLLTDKTSEPTVAPTTTTTSEPTTTLDYGDMENRRRFIAKMAQESWSAYHKSAWGHSALRPESKAPHDFAFGSNSGLTIVDSLSSLWIMELKEEYEKSRDWVQNELNFSSIDWNVPVAETVTDYIGGLVSIYALTQDAMFLDKAKKIAQVLEPAYNFDTGLPYESLNPKSGVISPNSENTLSRIGGQTLEYTYLSDLTQNPNLKTNRVKAIQLQLKSMEKVRGIYMDRMNVENGKWTSSTTSLFGKTRDFYTNLVKSFLQSGKQDKDGFDMYKETMKYVFQENPGLMQKFENGLLYTSIYSYAGPGCEKSNRRKRYSYRVTPRTRSSWSYVQSHGHWHGNLYYAHAHEPAEPTEPPCVFTYKQDFGWNYMEYSGCYLGSMFALGAHASQQVLSDSKVHVDTEESKRIKKHWEYAEALTKTCREASNLTKTGLGPQEFSFRENGTIMVGKRAKFLLGPELAESYFILYRLTHDPKYRDYAWQLAQSIHQHCKVENGYSTISNVDEIPTKKLDHQPARFLSATLKYLYLTFADDHVMPLEQWIFNSAGHPLPICGKNSAYPTKFCKV